MTTYAPDRLAELAELEREAWTAYRESLRGLEGREYDEAEAGAWDALQDDLADVAVERAALDDQASGSGTA